MGKFKFISILILAVVCICGIIMVVDAPTSFDESMNLIPISDSENVNQSDCENGTCSVDSNIDNSLSNSNDKDNPEEINYNSKYYEGSYIEGLYFCNDLDKAFKDAKAHHRNVMIIFDGAACIYCEYLKDQTLTDSAVQKEINENDIILITETSQSPELADELDIHGTPTTVIFDENGKELDRLEGYAPPDEYLAYLKEINGK
ncbi:MAG: thioredoxin fold domain-containing protein [Methanobrevibacter sp.]|nr:thioredoxin fold domain-containing protein [Methanobrevibacter sp.]